MASDPSEFVYNPQIFGGPTNVVPPSASQGWGAGQAEISPSLFHGADWDEKQAQNPPYPSGESNSK
jgi:hypothetical protein